MSQVEVIRVDYTNPQQGEQLIQLLNAYACDPMGGNEPLSEFCQQNLVAKLAETAGANSFIAYVDGQPAGLLNSFMAFSTFKCQPLINIHDVVVLAEFRGKQVSQKLLEKVESFAREQGCCKLTLEVLEGNEVAKQAYLKYGFAGYELDPEMGQAVFWQKVL